MKLLVLCLLSAALAASKDKIELKTVYATFDNMEGLCDLAGTVFESCFSTRTRGT
jgi:hypothetical protein